MRVKSEDEWQLFNAEIAADPSGVAEPFRDFVVAWAVRAEGFLSSAEQSPEFIASARNGASDAVEALRATLRSTENDVGRWTIGFVGQALVVLGTHWGPAGEVDDFFDSLTPIEQNLFADVVETKLVALAKAATPDGGEDNAPFTREEMDEFLK